MASRAGAPVASKRRRKNPSQPGDSSRSREASEESNAELTEAAGDDTDTGSITAPVQSNIRPASGSGSSPQRPGNATASTAADPAGPSSSAVTTGAAAQQNVFAHPATPQPSSIALPGSANTTAATSNGSSRARRVSPMAIDSTTATDGNESASTYDGDVSSAPVSSRRSHGHAHGGGHHAHTQSDASMTAPFQSSNNNNNHSSNGNSVAGGINNRAYFDTLASRSFRLQNMPSTSSMSIESVQSDGKDDTFVHGGRPESPTPQLPHAPPSQQHRHASPSGASTATTAAANPPSKGVAVDIPSTSNNNDSHSEAVHHPAPHGFLAKMSALDLQENVQLAIAGAGADGVTRNYKINEPPKDRPVRIYADGVYDLFHYGHALALRQAKLAFPSVHLIVGVCSDELVRKYKATPVMTSAERYESVRNCRWVDEVVEDAPWVIDQAFLDAHAIDYVAHDEAPYEGAQPGQSDIYRFVKDLGKFLPTRRTDGVSTSELLQRIVEGYRDGAYDKKLLKIGHPELCSGSEKGSSRSRGD